MAYQQPPPGYTPYPPQQQGYQAPPPQGYQAPPQQGYYPAPAAQQSTSNVVVVQGQPQPVRATNIWYLDWLEQERLASQKASRSLL